MKKQTFRGGIVHLTKDNNEHKTLVLVETSNNPPVAYSLLGSGCNVSSNQAGDRLYLKTEWDAASLYYDSVHRRITFESI